MTRLSAWWLRSAVAAALIASVGLPAAAEPWPGWRKDGSGVSQETGVPHEWGPSNNVRWKTRILGDGGSSPVVWGDQVFVTTTAAGKQKHSLHTAALVLVTLFGALALWGYLDGTFGDPLGEAGHRGAGGSPAGRFARKVLLVGAVVAVGYGTIMTCEKARDAVPLKYRNHLLGGTAWLNAPNAAQMSPNSPEEGVGVDTPSSAFRAFRNDSPNGGGRGLYWDTHRIPRACFYAGLLGGLTILGLNQLLMPRRRAGAAAPLGGVVRSAGRMLLGAAHLAGLLLGVCFILTVHSGMMADLRYVPDGVTWFLSSTIGCLGLLAVAAVLPRYWPWRLAASVLALAVGLFLSFTGPAAWNSRTAWAASFPLFAGLTAVAFVLSLAGSSWRRQEAGGAGPRWPRLRAALRPALLLALFATYFASANYLLPNSARMSEVVCVDRESGRIRWGTTCHVGRSEGKRHFMNTPASPTPVTDGEHVFAHFGEAGVYCLSMDGRVVWGYPDPAKPPHWGTGSSPILWGDFVVMTYDVDHESFTVALDKKTGAVRWRADRTGRVGLKDRSDGYGTPIVRTRGGEPELIHYSAGLLVGYAPRTGEERWSFPVRGEQPVATPVVWNDLIILLGGDYTPYTGAVRVVANGGSPPVPEEAWGSTRSVAKVCSPVVCGDYLYAVATRSGVATCLRAGTGDVVWKKRLGGSHFLASPTAADGKIFFCDSLGNTTVIAAGPEYRLLSRNALDEPVTASFAVSGGNLFIRGQDHLYCIGGAAPARPSP
jgi:outer membrane protein assembly factor BamB